MRVGVIGPLYADSLADNVVDGLRQLGHEPIALGAARPAVTRRRLNFAFDLATRSAAVEGAAQRVLVQRARKAETDAVLNVDARLSPTTVTALKALGGPVGLWYPDHVANLGRQLMFASDYDGVFVKEPELARRTQELLGLPILYVPEACNPRWHRPPPDAARVAEIAVVGNLYPYRVRLLERMVRAGLPIRIYGPPPPPWLASAVLGPHHSGRYVAREEKARVFRGAAAVLNGLHPAEMGGVNCRLFEATACGAAVLAEWRPALDELFAPGDEVLPFRTFDELVDQARWALDNDTAARAVGDRAVARAHADHTYEQRLKGMLDVLTGSTERPRP